MSIDNGTMSLSALQLKGGTRNDISAVNPLLASREIVVESDTGQMKVGDGIHYWNDLQYVGNGLGGGGGYAGELGNLESITVIDGEKEIATVGETWDYNNVRVLGQYSSGVAVDVTNQCNFLPKAGNSILMDGNYNIAVNYVYNGTVFQNTFTRQVVGTNDWLSYVNVTRNMDLHEKKACLLSFNVNAIAADDPTDIVIYSTVKTGDIVRDVVIGNYFSGTSMNGNFYNPYVYVSGNILFPSEHYTFSENSQVFFQNINNTLFTANIQLPNGIENCNSMFESSINMNCNVYMPNGVINCDRMFHYCRNFNKPVNIPDTVINCSQMFCNCNHFNVPITIPENVKSVDNMFYGCSRFNSTIVIEGEPTSLSSFLYGCYNFNQPLNIPDSVVNCSYMLFAANNMAYPVAFPANVNNVSHACGRCKKIEDIYIYNTSGVNVFGLVHSHSDSNVIGNVTIHCPNLAIIKKTTSGTSVTNTAITWDQNLYNATYKVQLTTDMSGYEEKIAALNELREYEMSE